MRCPRGWSVGPAPAFALPGTGDISPRSKHTAKPIFQLDNRVMTVRGIVFDTVNSLSAVYATECGQRGSCLVLAISIKEAIYNIELKCS